MSIEINNEETTPVVELTGVAKIKADILNKRRAQKLANTEKLLQTEVGSTLFVNAEDATKLKLIADDIVEKTGEKIRVGFTFDANTELIVGIAGALQYVKGADKRESLEAYYTTFTPAMRDLLLESYGNNPYLKEPTLLLIKGEMVNLNPEEVANARKGRRVDVNKLSIACEMMMNELDLVGELTITQEKADNAWNQANKKILTQEKLVEYGNDVDEDEVEESEAVIEETHADCFEPTEENTAPAVEEKRVDAEALLAEMRQDREDSK